MSLTALGATQHLFAEAERLAMADAPLEAWRLLEMGNLLGESGAIGALVERLKWHLSHLASREAYRDFYAADVPERPFLPFDCLPTLDRMMMRAALLRSRELMRMHCAGGVTANNMFRVFVVLHVSLMPALVVLFAACIPLVMLCVVYSMDQLLDDIRGHHISLAYLILQALNIVVMTLIVPMFVVPLAVVYRDIKNRLPKT